MGWKGTLRSVNAAVNRMEREQKRRQRELIQQRKQYEKMQALQKAQFEVQEFENYIEVLLSIHKECGNPWNWHEIVQIPSPEEPIRERRKEKIAVKKFRSYKPNLADKLLGQTEKKQNELKKAVEIARKRDEEEYELALKDYENSMGEWKKTLRIAKGVLSGDIKSYAEAVQEVNPLSEIDSLGSSIGFSIDPSGVTEVNIFVNSEEVVPSESRSLLKSGKLSIKAMPKTRFYEIYQDYVCGAVLRVARELFALLPIKFIIVTAVGEMLNTSTGHIEVKPILSVGISREIVEKLNFNALDPSDALSNFVHNMKFLKTKGFQEVVKLEVSDFDIA